MDFPQGELNRNTDWRPGLMESFEELAELTDDSAWD